MRKTLINMVAFIAVGGILGSVGESKEIPAVIKIEDEVVGLLMPIKQY